MTQATLVARKATKSGLQKALYRNGAFSVAGVRERLFSMAFRGMVYPQIWEDPVVDMEALAIQPTDHVVAIASGGCNILSYLIAGPARVTALDLNHAHIALNRLKLCAAQHMPGYRQFSDFFVRADLPSNLDLFEKYLAPALDKDSMRYWRERDGFGRRRISAFARGFYRGGLLGRFIGASHLLGRALGADPRALLEAKSLEDQRRIFDQKIAPAFRHWLPRMVLKNPASLYGLGIPPAQYAALAADDDAGITGVVLKRLERLACGFPMKDNYFAWQAFGRAYEKSLDAPLPPYLEEENFETVRAGARRVDVRHESMTDYLARMPDRSINCFVLLDAQDWMQDRQLTDLWRQIDRSAAVGARVIFRTAADERLLPGRIPDEILSAWTYSEARSRELAARDRSSIYGAFHLYTRQAI